MTSTMKTQRDIVVRGLFATLLAAFEGPNGQERDSDPVGRVLRKWNKTPAIPGMYVPALQFVGEDGGSVGAAETIRRRPGLALMFLSSLLRQVRPYRGSTLRISIAFNRSL